MASVLRVWGRKEEGVGGGGLKFIWATAHECNAMYMSSGYVTKSDA